MAHRIDIASPLHQIATVEFIDGCTRGQLGISVAFIGRDGVYHDDISSLMRYDATDLIFGHRFADVMTVSQVLTTTYYLLLTTHYLLLR